MAEPVADLVARVSSDIEPFRKGMANVVKTARDTSSEVATQLKKINDSFGSIGDAITSTQGVISKLAAFGAVGIAIGALVKGLSDALEAMKQIAAGADAVGVTTDRFQELTYAMSLAGVASKEQAEDLKKFSAAAYEAAHQQGDLYTALTKYNPAAATAMQSTKTLTDQLRVLANAVKAAGGEQERTALITAAFGKSNNDLRRFLIGGASGMDEAMQKARDLGITIDEDLIRRAPEIQERFATLAAVIDTQFKGSLVTLAPAIISVTEKLAQLAETTLPAVSNMLLRIQSIAGGIFDGLIHDKANQDLDTLEHRLGAINKQLEQLKTANPADANAGTSSWLDWLLGVDPDKRVTDWTQRINEAIAKLAAEKQQIEEIISSRVAATGWKASFEVNVERPDLSKSPSASDLARAQSELLRIEQDYYKATKQGTELAQLEYQKRRDDLDAMLKAQTISYGDYIKAVAELEGTLTAKINEEALKRIKPVTDAISGTLSRAFSDFIERGKLDFGDLARSMIAKIAEVQFQLAILQPLFGGGSTPGGGVVGNALAGIFHEGGMVGGGGRTRSVPGLAFAAAPRFHNGGFPGLRAGEVPAILERGETVLPRNQSGRGWRGQSITVNIQTPDVEGFRRSQGQVTAMIARAAQAGQRNM